MADARARAPGRGAKRALVRCFWGAAYTLGPNYNIPMLPDRAEAAWDALTKAQAAAAATTPVEQALIDVLAKRYQGPAYVDPVAIGAYHQAHAAAMRDVAAKFPDDDDVQVLFAEALMNVNPWKLWTPEGVPAEGTPEIVSTLRGSGARQDVMRTQQVRLGAAGPSA